MSEFANIRDALVKYGLPMLGAALPVPGGAAIATALADAIGAPSASPSDILKHLGEDADAIEKAKEFETFHAETILRIAVDAERAAIEAVNATMRAESASEHWPTYSWRPFIGFMFGSYVGSMFILPLLHIQPVTLSPDLTIAIGSVLGVASWFRGKMQADPSIQTVNRG